MNLPTFPHIQKYQKIIYSSAILHDMCDKKYMCEKEGFQNICDYFQNDFTQKEFLDMKKIITTMSYSTVKKNGFPNHLNHLEIPYNIVREADLLSAYDFDRCMIYSIFKSNKTMFESYDDSDKLFNKRVLKYIDDKLFITSHGKKLSLELEIKALDRIEYWNKIINSSWLL